ncbi:AAA family ATPase [Candidatus Dojkabacteria bacterium]|uniref:AAA family ATPase n=1 Tax=Candidatus Dojkabacteria bacterium TaxID=2099670 RepID=A0A955I8L0_9BACT|nr:AAA family ATPase [Candidatus Dojkabacteria bacterium]
MKTGLEYLIEERGLTEETINHFRLNSDEKGNINIPIIINDIEIGIKKRMLSGDRKYLNPKGLESQLFNLDTLETLSKDKKNLLIVAEGEIDVMSLEQYGYKAVCSTTGVATNHDSLIELAEHVDALLFAFDNDKAGLANSLKVAQKCKGTENNIRFMMLDDFKDWNELVVANTHLEFDDMRKLIHEKIKSLSLKPLEFIRKYGDSSLYKLLDINNLQTIVDSDSNNLEYLIEGLIHKKTINLISGQSGVGKSILTQILAGTLSEGLPVFDEFYVDRSYKVGFLDRENGLSILKDRFLRIECNKENIEYIDLKASFNSTVISELKEAIRDFEIDVLVIDTLVRFQEGNENDSKDINEFFKLLRELLNELECIVVIHHLKKLSKDQKSNNDSARGSSDIIASVDTHFILEKRDDNLLTFKNVKNRLAEEVKPMTLELQIDELISLKFIGDVLPESIHKVSKTKKLIVDYLDVQKESDFNSIAQYVKDGGGYSQNKVRDLLKDFIDQNVIDLFKVSNKYMYKLNEDDNSYEVESIFTPQQNVLQ